MIRLMAALVASLLLCGFNPEYRYNLRLGMTGDEMNKAMGSTPDRYKAEGKVFHASWDLDYLDGTVQSTLTVRVTAKDGVLGWTFTETGPDPAVGKPDWILENMREEAEERKKAEAAEAAWLKDQPKPKASTAPGKWRATERTNPLDDSRTAILTLEAADARSILNDAPLLVLRCQSGKTEAYINWDDYLGSTAMVTIRFGDTAAVTSEWLISSNNESTFPRQGGEWFAKRLLRVDRLVAQVTPYNANPVTAVFDVRGLDFAIPTLRETCAW